MHQNTPPMHPAQARQRLARRFQRHYSWLLLVLVLAGVVADKAMWAKGGSTKGFVLGVFLGYVAQSLFFWLNHLHCSSRSMSAMYLAVTVKWLIALLGFAGIFWAVQGVSGEAVILGFFLMHLAMVVLVQHLAG